MTALTPAVVAVDPELVPLLERAAAAGGLLGMTVADARLSYRALAEERVPLAPRMPVEQFTVPTADGNLLARIYRPTSVVKGRNAVLYFHGGGYAIGDLDTHDPVCRRLAAASRMPLVSIGYRLAPEHPHPAARKDGVAAAHWMLDPATCVREGWSHVVLAGDSAGANLAAWTAIALTACADVAGLLLIYPNVAFAHTTGSRTALGDNAMLSTRDIARFGELYLAGAPEISLLDAELALLGSAIVVTAGHDPLRDEGVELVDAILRAGGEATSLHFAEQVHGFVNLAHFSRSAARAVDEIGVVIARRYGPPE